MTEPTDIIDWDDMSEEDKRRVMELHKELNDIFDRYTNTEPDKDEILDD